MVPPAPPLPDTHGPLLTLIWNAAAADQRHRTCHLWIVPYLKMAGDSRTELPHRSGGEFK